MSLAGRPAALLLPYFRHKKQDTHPIGPLPPLLALTYRFAIQYQPLTPRVLASPPRSPPTKLAGGRATARHSRHVIAAASPPPRPCRQNFHQSGKADACQTDSAALISDRGPAGSCVLLLHPSAEQKN